MTELGIGGLDTSPPVADDKKYIASPYVSLIRDGAAPSGVTNTPDGRVTVRSSAGQSILKAWQKAGNSRLEDVTEFANQEYAQSHGPAADSSED